MFGSLGGDDYVKLKRCCWYVIEARHQFFQEPVLFKETERRLAHALHRRFAGLKDCLQQEVDEVEVCLHDVWLGDIVLSHLVPAPCCQRSIALLTCGIIHKTQKITLHILLTFHCFIEKLRLQWSSHCARSSEAWVNNHDVVMESLALLTLVGVWVSVNIFIIQFLTTDLREHRLYSNFQQWPTLFILQKKAKSDRKVSFWFFYEHFLTRYSIYETTAKQWGVEKNIPVIVKNIRAIWTANKAA